MARGDTKRVEGGLKKDTTERESVCVVYTQTHVYKIIQIHNVEEVRVAVVVVGRSNKNEIMLLLRLLRSFFGSGSCKINDDRKGRRAGGWGDQERCFY